MGHESQPNTGPSISPKMKPASAPLQRTWPRGSARLGTEGTLMGCHKTETKVTTPVGRLRKKIQFQLAHSISPPPTTGPATSAHADTPPHTAIALLRSAGDG
ncbi:hypothetical protein D9M68_747160 [compost metagenome]